MTKKILIAVTSSQKSVCGFSGTYFPELTHFLQHIVDAGIEYDIVSPKAGVSPVNGDDREDEINERFLDDENFMNKLQNSLPLDEVDKNSYDAVFYPGGYGLLFDLAKDKVLSKITAEIYEKGGVVSAVCHGPAGLLNSYLSNGKNILEGKKATCFTEDEEIDYNTFKDVPFILEKALKDKGAVFSKAPVWQEYVVVDGGVITGQNPASAAKVAKELLRQI